jgi:hypothetical protein
MVERQELHCHNCDRYVQFDIDTSLNGRHVLNCPNCGHEHCRIVNNGIISDERWDSRNDNIPNIMINTYTIMTTAASTYTLYSGTTAASGTTDSAVYASWMNSTTGAVYA